MQSKDLRDMCRLEVVGGGLPMKGSIRLFFYDPKPSKSSLPLALGSMKTTLLGSRIPMVGHLGGEGGGVLEFRV